ncbi:hypothetical protein [Candidatus Deianiraea vastatrix]|nr:hypothetical protein [Candidatus Deianiraea vastatrix]
MMETHLMKLIHSLERDTGVVISDIVLCLPDSMFAIEKLGVRHIFFFDLLEADKGTRFRMKSEIWQHFEDLSKSNVLMDIETMKYISSDGEVMDDIRYIKGGQIKSINLGLYILGDIAARISSMLNACNLRLRFSMPISYAMRHCFVGPEDDSMGILLINIGHSEISYCVLGSIGAEKSGIIRLGSHFIVVQIAKELNIEIRMANKIFRLYLSGSGVIDYANLGDFVIDKIKLKKIIVKSIERLFGLLNKDFISSGRSCVLEKIIIDGDLKNLETTRDVAKNIFDVPIYSASISNETDLSKTRYDVLHGVISKYIKNRIDLSEISDYKMNLMGKFYSYFSRFAYRLNGFI